MIVELGFIYYLQNPLTGEIFYVGSTTTSLVSRLRTHYQHLREYERGLRYENKRYVYLKNLRPVKATIHLIEIVTNADLDEREIFHIKNFRRSYPNLTNMTDGGRGKHTSKYYTEEQKKIYGEKISKSLKGRPKPDGFAEHLSNTRKGLGNPATKELKKWIVALDNLRKPLKLFKYGFEVNIWTNRPFAYGNVYKKVGSNRLSYGNYWEYYDNLPKELQDIVRSDYESN